MRLIDMIPLIIVTSCVTALLMDISDNDKTLLKLYHQEYDKCLKTVTREQDCQLKSVMFIFVARPNTN